MVITVNLKYIYFTNVPEFSSSRANKNMFDCVTLYFCLCYRIYL